MNIIRILLDDATTPLWLTILISLTSGLIATVITLIVQTHIEKKKIKVNLFLNLVSLRDCCFKDNIFKNNINKVQVVFYKHSIVIEKYKKFISSINDNVFYPDEKIITDEFIGLLEAMADVVGYKDFNWESIKERFTTEDLYNNDFQETTNGSKNISNGLKKARKNKNSDVPPEGKGDKQ